MKPHIIQHSLPKVMTPADRLLWQQSRLKSIGGSDVAALFGMNEYMSSLELFHLFTGQIPQQSKDSMATITGTLLEDDCCALWSYWAGNEETLVQNYAAGKKVQSGIEIHATCYHPDQPHLHANIDRQILHNYSGRAGILEAKCPRSIAYEKYDLGFPPSHIFQMMHYLNVCDEEYAELSVLKDGRVLEVFPFERNENIISAIKTKTAEFWEKVTNAREVMSSDLTNEKKQQLITDLEPEPDASPAWETYLKDKFKGDQGEITIEGNQQQWEWGIQHLEVCNEMKALKEREQLITNSLKNEMRDAWILDFQASGKITWKPDKNGKRTFRNGLKV